jgi:hypothetical protein
MGAFIAHWLINDRGVPDWLVYSVCVMFGAIVTLAYAIPSAPALREWRPPDFPVPKSDFDGDIVDFVQRRAHTVPAGSARARWRGRRLRAARPRARGPARRRRLGDADDHAREHERPALMIGEKGADLIRGRAPAARAGSGGGGCLNGPGDACPVARQAHGW